MEAPLHVVLFKTLSPQQETLTQLLKRRDFRLNIVSTVSEVKQLLQEENSPIEAFFLPTQLSSGTSASTLCLELRADPELANTPIIALAQVADKPALRALYELGVDVLMLAPFDADFLYLQAKALSRVRESAKSRAETLQEKQELIDRLRLALNLSGSGIVILNSQYEMLDCNRAACLLLGLSEDSTHAGWSKILPTLLPDLSEHEKETRKQIGLLKPQRESSLVSRSITRPDGQVFRGEIEIYSIFDEAGRIVSYALKLVDLSQIRQIASNLFHAQRTKALSLMTCAACINLVAPKIPAERSALSATSKALEALPKTTSSINLILTALLEFLDLVMSPAISLKVAAQRDLQLAVKSSDLIQILGHLILHACEFVGSEGEIVVESGDHQPGEGVSLLVSASSNKALPFLSDPHLASLIDLNLTNFLGKKHMDLMQASGLLAAQKTAQLYRTTIEYKHPTESSLKMRIRLPLAQKSGQS